MSWLITKYLLTAGVVVLVSEIAKRSDKLGGLVAALPLVTILALIWLYVEDQPTAKIANHAWYTFDIPEGEPRLVHLLVCRTDAADVSGFPRIAAAYRILALPACLRDPDAHLLWDMGAGATPSWNRTALTVAQTGQCLLQAIDSIDLDILDCLLGLIGLGNDGMGESQLGGLLQTFLTALHRAHLSGQTNLTKNNKFLRQWSVFQG